MELIGELGSNWRKQLLLASKLHMIFGIQEVAECRGTIAKIQLFNADRLYNKERAPKQWAIAKRYEVPLEWLPELQKTAREAGIKLWASVFDPQTAEESAPYLDGLKIASGDITNYHLIDFVFKLACENHIDFAMSTGASTMEEVEAAFDRLTTTTKQANRIFVFHCVSKYPAEPEDYNMTCIEKLKRFGIVGISDHTQTLNRIMIGMAVGLGARAFEKHLMPRPTKLMLPDSCVSVFSGDFVTYAQYIRMAMKQVGDGIKKPMEAEMSERVWARRGPDGLRPDITGGGNE